MARVRVEVSGVVQGVGFRWFARETAQRLGLAGWVRNRDDGCVEVAAEGDEHQVRQLLAALERGPRGARVERVTHLPIAEHDSLDRPFTVRR